jgi:imidazolonepropionase-like amidohydrolase
VRILYRSAAVADGTGPEPALEQSLLVVGDRIEYLGPDEEAPAPPMGCRVVDAGGATVVPGLVDAHSHTVLPGGSHWIERIGDDTGELLRVAEENGARAHAAGIRWLRDVGSPPREGRALALRVRDAWAGRDDRPYLRAAGTWISRTGTLPPSYAVEADHADDLMRAVEQQLDDGADLVKLYLDGPDLEVAPWTADEVARAVAAATARGAAVTAHATTLPGARAAVRGGIHCLEHGSQLDDELAAEMARRGTFLVPTLAVLASFATFAETTWIERFTSVEGRAALQARRERAYESVGLAHRAGVPIAAGSDFGGGSVRAGHLPWEVECLAAAGLAPWEALAAATWVGGDLLGEPGAGRLAPGGRADFFLVHGNPLRDPSALWRVWRIG